MLTDVDLARTIAQCGITGRLSEWPQLRGLLERLADRVEWLEKEAKALEVVREKREKEFLEVSNVCRDALDLLR